MQIMCFFINSQILGSAKHFTTLTSFMRIPRERNKNERKFKVFCASSQVRNENPRKSSM